MYFFGSWSARTRAYLSAIPPVVGPVGCWIPGWCAAPLLGFLLPWSFSFEVFFDARFSRAQSPGQRNFGVIVAVEAGYVLFMSAGYGLLGLHHFHGVRNTRAETVSRLGQRCVRQFDIAPRHVHQLR